MAASVWVSALLFSAYSLLAAEQLPLASTIPYFSWIRCNISNPHLNTCLKEAAQKAILGLKGGIPALGVPSIDILQTEDIDVTPREESMSFTMPLKNIRARGFSKANVEAFKVDLMNNTFSILSNATVLVAANYELKGSVLLLPVKGSGICKFRFKNVTTLFTIEGVMIEKNRRTHFNVMKSNLNIKNVQRMEMRFYNMFDGEKSMEDPANALMNDNWEDMLTHLKNPFQIIWGNALQNITKLIFDQIAIDELFIK